MWTNMSQQWSGAALSTNHLNLSEADIEKLISSASNRKSGLLFMTGRPNSEKRNPVSCIPEPSMTFNLDSYRHPPSFKTKQKQKQNKQLNSIIFKKKQVRLCRAKTCSTGGPYGAEYGSSF